MASEYNEADEDYMDSYPRGRMQRSQSIDEAAAVLRGAASRPAERMRNSPATGLDDEVMLALANMRKTPASAATIGMSLRDASDMRGGGDDGMGYEEEEDDEAVDARNAEHFKTGRWTSDEHKLFLKGLEIHGKEWKKIADVVQSRSLVQIRTHAQKYFLKVSKTEGGASSSIKSNSNRRPGRVAGELGEWANPSAYMADPGGDIEPPPKPVASGGGRGLGSGPGAGRGRGRGRGNPAPAPAAGAASISMAMPARWDSHASAYDSSRILMPFASVVGDVLSANNALGSMFAMPASLQSMGSLATFSPLGPVPIRDNRPMIPPPLMSSDLGRGGVKLNGVTVPDSRFMTRKLSLEKSSFGQLLKEDSPAAASAPDKKEKIPQKFSSLKIINPEHIPKPRVLLEIMSPTFSAQPAPLTPLTGLPKTPTTVEVKGRSALHHVIVRGDVAGVARIVKGMASTATGTSGTSRREIDVADHYGFTSLMTASCLQNMSLSLTLVTMLLEAGADPHLADHLGYTSLHWAASVGNVEVAKVLIAWKSNVNVKSLTGETPLHCAARLGRHKMLVALVTELAADLGVRNKDSESAFDVAGILSSGVVNNEDRVAMRSLMLELIPAMKTLILHHPKCDEHCPRDNGSQGASPWEAPERIEVILKHLQTPEQFLSPEIAFDSDFKKISFTALSKVHSNEYIRGVHELSEQVIREGKSVPFTPRVQSLVHKTPIDQLKSPEACDTSFSAGTLDAARFAAGSVCHAIDLVLEKKARNAFCCVRPPGHHAGVKGLMQNSVSCGFCIFNNICIGAMHALQTHADVVKRVAIIDIDVHHGNGTEEIMSKLDQASNVFFFSIHLFDKEYNETTGASEFEFYPGSGDKDDIMHNIVNTPLQPLWKQAERGAARRACPGHFGRSEFRKMVESRMLPAVRAFCPDIILVSAGFDGGKGDVGNCRHYESNRIHGLDLLPEDYTWMTEKIVAVANLCCDGRVVSVLEGGYGQYLRGGVGGELDRSNLAANCSAHVRGLVGPMPISKKKTIVSPGIATAVPSLASDAEGSPSDIASRKRKHRGSSADDETAPVIGDGATAYVASAVKEKSSWSNKRRKFCICNNKAVENRSTMIECCSGVRCGGWVHPGCVGLGSLRDDEMRGLEDFICPMCRAEGLVLKPMSTKAVAALDTAEGAEVGKAGKWDNLQRASMSGDSLAEEIRKGMEDAGEFEEREAPASVGLGIDVDSSFSMSKLEPDSADGY